MRLAMDSQKIRRAQAFIEKWRRSSIVTIFHAWHKYAHERKYKKHEMMSK